MRVHSKTSSGKLSKDQKVHLRHFRYSEMQNFRQIMTPPVKFFDSRNFQKHQRPSTNFLTALDKNFFDKIFDNSCMCYSTFRSKQMDSA